MNFSHDERTRCSRQRDDVGEQAMRSVWNVHRQAEGPSAEAVANVKRLLREAAARRARSPVSGMVSMLMGAWQPIAAVAACLLIAAGGFYFRSDKTTLNVLWNELATVENEMTREIHALETTVWEALSELEADAPTNDLLLHTLALQMKIWEDM